MTDLSSNENNNSADDGNAIPDLDDEIAQQIYDNDDDIGNANQRQQRDGIAGGRHKRAYYPFGAFGLVKKSGIATQCCEKRCTLAYLKTYCCAAPTPFQEEAKVTVEEQQEERRRR